LCCAAAGNDGGNDDWDIQYNCLYNKGSGMWVALDEPVSGDMQHWLEDVEWCLSNPAWLSGYLLVYIRVFIILSIKSILK